MNKRLKDIFDSRNYIFLILFIVVVASGVNAGMTLSAVSKINHKIDILQAEQTAFINKVFGEPKQQQNPAEDDFSKLSAEATYYHSMLDEKVTGTPTWIINGKKYVGFDYQNNKVPGFEGEFETVILFSSPTCSYCAKAESYLNLLNIEYTKVCTPIHSGDFEKCDESYVK